MRVAIVIAFLCGLRGLACSTVIPRRKSEWLRPQFHYQAPNYWMNDPMPIVTMGDKHHLFYQFNPKGALWGNMSWGHATSKDLVTWSDMPVGFEPTEAFDKEGVFTGSPFWNVKTNEMNAAFTGATEPGISWAVPYKRGMETQNLARFTNKDLSKYELDTRNPVIPEPPPDVCVTGFRDPNVWYDTFVGAFRMLLGGGLRHMNAGGECDGYYTGGAVFLYESPDASNWTYKSTLLHSDKTRGMGNNWECPNILHTLSGLVTQGERPVVLIMGYQPSDNPRNRSAGYVQGVLNEQDGTVSIDSVQALGTLDYGNLYAVTSFSIEENQQLIMGWSEEDANDAWIKQQGWAGVLSLPRVVTAQTESGLLGYEPISLGKLEKASEALSMEQSLTSFTVPDGFTQDNSYHLRTVLNVGTSTQPSSSHPIASIRVMQHEHTLYTSIDLSAIVDSDGGTYLGVYINRTYSSPYCKGGHNHMNDDFDDDDLGYDDGPDQVGGTSEAYVNCFTEMGRVPYFDGASREIPIEILVDRSIIELFVAGTMAMTTRVYPTKHSTRATLSTVSPAFFQGVYVAHVDTIWPSSSRLPTGQVDAAIVAGGITVGAIAIIFFVVWLRKIKANRNKSTEAKLRLLDEALSADEGDPGRIKHSRSSRVFRPTLDAIHSDASESEMSA